MRGTAKPLCGFFDSSTIRLVIPVYQRNYDWRTTNCDQLFSDLVKLKQTGRTSHFFGSIVTASGQYDDRLIIDGQQRLTTISLLLLAGIKSALGGKIAISGNDSLNHAHDVFIVAKYASNERKTMLVPIDEDMNAYDRVVESVEKAMNNGGSDDNDDSLVRQSNVTRNYRHFLHLLDNGKMAFDDLLDTVNRLQIIHIELDHDDDAQLIFESLNSTGLALTEADKVRNYLLMSLPDTDQKTYFKNYWQRIEQATDGQPTMFLRDYLTIRSGMQRHASMANIYPEWKKYMGGRDRKEELVEMAKYAAYYKKIVKADMVTPKLSEKMSHICNIETDVANVFFLQVLIYAEQTGMTDDELWRVIDLVENYLARRIVCGLPANALTQVFCALHKDVLRSLGEYTSAGQQCDASYADILAYHILRREGNSRLPRNEQFAEAAKTRDVYNMVKPQQIFLFERLENALPGEHIDVAREMKSKEATIEHIMPQTLTAEWKTMLGPDYETIAERYLHTAANLTLTGVNSELSNKPFKTKRDGTMIDGQPCKGYKQSKYRLSHSLATCEKWTAEEMEKRGDEIKDALLRLYPMPATTFKPLPKPVDEVTLEDESFSPTYRRLRGFRLFDETYNETKWKNMFVAVSAIVLNKYPYMIDEVCDKNRYYVSENEQTPDDYVKVVAGCYVRYGLSNESKLWCLNWLFLICGIPFSELTLLLEPSKAEKPNLFSAAEEQDWQE